MNKIVFLFFLVTCFLEGFSCYFTLPGKCPENVQLQNDFKFLEFFGNWKQVYHYCSNGEQMVNCSTVELYKTHLGRFMNQSRIDNGLFHRYSIAKVMIPWRKEESPALELTFSFEDAPRRLKDRKYTFRVLTTNYINYATVYTCSYSEAIDKHYIYVWVLQRDDNLTKEQFELAASPLTQIGLQSSALTFHDWSQCSPKYFEDKNTEPPNFKTAVKI